MTIEIMISNPPKLHYWNNDWQLGGMTPHMLTKLYKYSIKFNRLRIIETGAGLSSIAFLLGKPIKLISIAPDKALKARILKFLDDNNIDKHQYQFIEDISEEVLPNISKNNSVDFALIDGGHGMHTVFVDFTYFYKMLKKDGILAIDDLQLYSVKQLFLLLKSQPELELCEVISNKLAFFRKLTDKSYLPDFSGQPFIMSNS